MSKVAGVGWAIGACLWLGACAPAQDDGPAASQESSTFSTPATPQTKDAQASIPERFPAPHADVPTAHKAMYVGTWPPSPEADFDESWLDEAGTRVVFTLERARRRIWKGFTTDTDSLPVDFLARGREGPAVAYVYILVFRDDESLEFPDDEGVLHIRHHGRLQARYDGQLVIDAPASTSGLWSEAQAKVRLTGPYDVVLLKLGRGNPELGDSMNVQVRLSALDGTPIPTQGWNTMRPPGRPTDLEPPLAEPSVPRDG